MTMFELDAFDGAPYPIYSGTQYVVMFNAGRGDAHGCFVGTFEGERSTPSHLTFRGEAAIDVLVVHPTSIKDIHINVYEEHRP